MDDIRHEITDVMVQEFMATLVKYGNTFDIEADAEIRAALWASHLAVRDFLNTERVTKWVVELEQESVEPVSDTTPVEDLSLRYVARLLGHRFGQKDKYYAIGRGETMTGILPTIRTEDDGSQTKWWAVTLASALEKMAPGAPPPEPDAYRNVHHTYIAFESVEQAANVLRAMTGDPRGQLTDEAVRRMQEERDRIDQEAEDGQAPV